MTDKEGLVHTVPTSYAFPRRLSDVKNCVSVSELQAIFGQRSNNTFMSDTITSVY